jgi:DNA-binding CsgD family transcriptional regulator
MISKKYTECEQLNFNQLAIFKLSAHFLNNNSYFIEIADYIPYYIFTNFKKNLVYNYANNKSIEALEVSEFSQITLEWIKEKFDPQLTDFVFNKIKNFENINDKRAICTTIQKFKINNKMNWIIGNKVIVNDNEFFNIQYTFDDLGLVGAKLSELLSPFDSNINLWQRFKSLSKREKYLLSLIATGITNKSISEKLYISEHTVRTHREQIRKKIDAHNIHEMIKFAEAFELIGAL